MRRVADSKLLVHLLLLIGAISLPCLQPREGDGRKCAQGEAMQRSIESFATY